MEYTHTTGERWCEPSGALLNALVKVRVRRRISNTIGAITNVMP
jgi:hypothetical protein